jgi:hypothetical protein
MLGMQRKIARREPLGCGSMQGATTRFERRLVDGVAKQRVCELQLDAVTPNERGCDQLVRLITFVCNHATGDRELGALAKHGSGFQCQMIL